MSALALLQELLALRMDVLGQQHPVTLQTTELLAAIYLKQAMPQFAADLYEEVTYCIMHRVAAALLT